MPEEELMLKSEEIYRVMLQQKDLSAFEFKNTHPEDYIEFPDEYTTYNSVLRKWESTREIHF